MTPLQRLRRWARTLVLDAPSVGGAAERVATVEACEPRILYAADLNPALWAAGVGDAPTQALVASVSTATADNAPDTRASNVQQSPLRREIIFIDAGVANADQLLQGLLDSRGAASVVEVVQIASDTDGLRLISEVLAHEQGITAVHVMSHGRSGAIQLGRTMVDAGALSERSAELTGWQTALAADADLLLWGCDVGAGPDGAAFVARLAQLTGADVAASTDTTGHASLGGDWDLEQRVGAIETAVVLGAEMQQSWGHVLPIAQDAVSTGTASNGASSATVSHTTASGSDRLMLVGISFGVDNGVSVTSVTYNGVALTLVGSQDGAASEPRVEIWRLVAPATVTANVVVNFSGSGHDGVAVGVTTFTGVNQTTPLGTFAGTQGNSSSPSVTVASATNELVFGVAAYNNGSDGNFNPGAGQTEQWDLYGSTKGNGSGTTEAGAASVVTSWTIPGSFNWAAAGVSIKAANSAPTAAADSYSLTEEGTLTVSPPSTGLQDLWRFDEGGASQVAADSAGTAENGTRGSTAGVDAADPAWATSRAGNAALSFDGSDDYVFTNSTTAKAASNFTLSAWFQTDVTIGAHHILWQGYAAGNGYGDPGVNTAASSEMSLSVGSYDLNNKIVFFLGYDLPVSGADPIYIVSASDFTETTAWHHVAVSVSDLGGGVFGASLYVDGVLEGSDTGTQMDRSQWDGMQIGRTGSNTRMFDGRIDEVRVYNSSLTLGQVQNIANPGLLQNDSDPELPSSSLDAILVSGPTNGTLALQKDGSFTYTPVANFSGTDSFTYKVNDGLIDSNVAAVTLTVNPVNDAPVLDNTGTMTMGSVGENSTSATTVSGLISTAGGNRITDVDAGAVEGIAITASNNGNGRWRYSIDGGSTYIDVGTVAEGSALLLRSTDMIAYTGDGTNGGTADITFRAWDRTSGTEGTKVDASVNGGTTALSSATESASITTTSVNDAPVLGFTGTIGMPGTDENTTSAATLVSDILISGLRSDVDTGALTGIAILTSSGNGTFQFSTDGVTWTNVGAVTTSNALLLTSTSRVRYVPDGSNGETAAFTYKAWDQTTGTASANGAPQYAAPGGGGGTTAYSSQTGTVQLTVSAVNDAPVLADTALSLTVAEDAGAPSGAVGSLLSAFTGGITDFDSGAVKGLAITATVETNGTWYYSTNGGTNWTAVGAVSNTSALLLADNASTRLYFAPTANYNGTSAAALTLRGWDQTSGSAGTKVTTASSGGTTAFSSATDTVDVTVTAVNDAPTATITPASYSATEQVNLTLHGTGLSIADSDAASASVQATIAVGYGTLTAGAGATGVTVAGSGTATVTLTGTITQINNLLANLNSGTLTYSANTDAPPASTTLTLTANDLGNTGSGGALTGNDTATINITALNDAPVLAVNAAALPYASGQVAIDPALTLTDDSASIASATVRFSAGYIRGEDSFVWVNQLGITGTFNATTGTLSLSGATTVANYQTALRSIQYENLNGSPTTGTLRVSFTVNDGALGSNTGQRNLTIVDDQPPRAAHDSGTVAEAAAVVIDLAANDNDNVALNTGTLVVVTGPAHGSVVTHADGTVTYTHDGSEATTDSFTYTIKDNIGLESNIATVDLGITPVNDAPTLGLSTGSASYTENTTAWVDASATLADVDNANFSGGTLTVQITANGDATDELGIVNQGTGAGQIGLSGGNVSYGGVTIGSYGSFGNGSTPLVVAFNANATPTAALALLRNLSYRTTSDSPSTATRTLGYTLTDGSGGTSSTATLSMSVVAANDAPVLADSALAITVAEDAGAPSGAVGSLLSAFTGGISDADPGASKGIAITATDETNGTWYYSTNGGTNWTAVGAVSNTSALLLADNASTRLYFAPGGNYSSTSSAALTLRGWDQTSGAAGTKVTAASNGGTTAFSSTTDTVDVTVTAANDAPVLADTALPITVAEDAGAPSGAVGSLLSVFTGGITDVDSGAVKGIAITATVETNGTWYYSTNGGTNWTAVGAVTNTSALLLADNASTRLYFAPEANFNGSSAGALTLRGWDQTSGAAGTKVTTASNGGTTAFSSATDVIDVTVTAVNDAPVLADTALAITVAEDAGAPAGGVGSLLSAFTGGLSDADSSAAKGIAITATAETNGTWYYSTNSGSNWTVVGAVTNTSALLLADNASTRLYFAPAANFNGSAAGALTLRGWDQTSGAAGTKVTTASNGGTTAFSSATDVIDVTVTAVNDAPTITDGATATLTGTTEDEISPGTTVVSILTSASWADADSGPLKGIAVASTTGSGTWQYSTDGVTWNVFGTVSSTSALLLESTAQVRYIPDGSNAEMAAFGFFAWDQTTGTASTNLTPAYANPGVGGGTTAYSSQLASASMTVTAVNDAPVFVANATALGFETQVNTTTTDIQTINANSRRAMASDASGNFVVVWASNLQDGALYGIYGQRYAADGTALGGEFLVNTTTSDTQILPAVAMDTTGNFVVTWSSNNQDGSGYGVYAQRYSAAAAAQGGEFLVNSTTSGGQLTSQIAMSASGQFVIVWGSSTQDPDSSGGIYAQRYDANGVAQGGEFRVNSYTAGTQTLAAIAMDATANFVVTWASNLQDGSNYGVYGQLFSASGVAQGSEFAVNTTTADSQLYHDVAMTSDGRFVVTFQSRNADGSYEVYLQRYSAAGAALGPQTRVNATTVTSAQQPIPSVSVDPAGHVAVVWNSSADGNGLGVVGRVFDWSGTAVTGEFQVNTTTTGSQAYPKVMSQAGGGIVVAWGGDGTGDADGVFMQRYGLQIAGNAFTSITEDATTNAGDAVASLIAVCVMDVDVAALSGIAVTALNSGSGSWQYSTNNGTSWSNVGSVSTASALLLGSADKLRFVPDAYNATSASVTFQAWDQSSGLAGTTVSTVSNGGTSAFSSAAYTAEVTVTAVNDAPVLADTALSLTVAEDAGAPSGAVGSPLSAFTGGITDVDSGAVKGIAITATVETNGTWYYSTNSGNNWTLVGAVTNTSALLLGDNPSTRLYFAPAANFNGSSAGALTLRAWDQTSGSAGSKVTTATNGGTSAFSTATDVVDVSVTAVNDAPVVTAASLTLSEGATVTLGGANFGISDPDDGSFTYTVSGASGGLLQLSSNAGVAITSFSSADLAGGLVQLVDDGNEFAPAFSVTVNDGDVDSNTLAATINYTAVNDAPVVTASSLTLNEGDTVTLSGANFGVSDPDDGSFTFAVSGVSGGIFQLSSSAGVVITSFSSADLAGGLVQFVDDGNEVAPAFSVTINDGDVDSNTLAASINYTAVNDAPVVTGASLNLNEGDTVTLGGANFGVTDPDDGAFVYTVSGATGGIFQLSNNAGAAITSFSSADLAGGLVQFVDDGNEVAPAFDVTVNDGDVDSNTLAATINYTPVNDAPVVTAANLTLNEGETVTLSGANFGVTDPDDTAFVYTVSGVMGGIFQLSSNAGAAITSFSSAALAGGLVQFVDDGNEAAPAFSVTVNDGDVDSNTLAATINYSPVNDTSIVTSAILTLNEGETITLSPANFGINDPDDSSFVYTVSGVAGGFFQLSSNVGAAITSFSSADLAGGLVQFVDDANESAPAFSVTVNDGDVDSNTMAATVNYTPVNDAPAVTAASLMLNEGETVTLSPANFGITDPDDTSFVYTVSGAAGGFFQLSSNVGAAITSFSSADLAGGLVQFVDDANESAPAFSVTVNDGDVDSNTMAATVNYTPVNDAPAVTAASLMLNEGETVTLSPANFGITDPDDTSFVYTVSGVAGGFFQLSSNVGAAITSFSSADLAGGLVQFVDDGNEVAPAFSVTVNDGDVDSNTLAATINYLPVNDAPVVPAASLTLNEGETVTLSGTNFSITDPDDGSFTYTVSGVSGGIFQLSNNIGVPVTSFSSADLAGGLVQFVDDGNEVGPAFSVTVNDGDVNSNTLAATINYTAVNDAPVAIAASLTLNEGDTVTLSPANFGISDPDDGSFAYTFSGVSGGIFQLSSNAGVAITSFSSADLAGGLVQFVDDGNEAAPAFSVTANDGDVDSNTLAATINYSPANDAPVVTGASLTLNEGHTVTLNPANFGVSDPDDSSFTYTVSGVSGGIFQLSSNAGVSITSFSSADLAGGLVQFVDDGNETAPAFNVTVNDGDVDSNTLAATVNYSPANDAPVVTAASLTLNEGDIVTLSHANFGISDPDDSSFVYTVSGVTGGIFQLSSNAGVAINSFSSADLAGGLVRFVDDGNEVAPAFSVTVNDGDVDSNTLAATVNYSPANDAPVVTAASLTLNEGDTVTLSHANFGISDPDDSGFVYTVSGVTGGIFQLSSNAGAAITSFSSADLAGGLVQFVDDGNETAPAFSFTVNDGDVDSNTLAATINYTAVNDAPVATAASLTLNEGDTVTLSPANFGINDPDDGSFTYTVSGVSGGIFQLSSNAGAPITSFSSADLAGGLVQFVDDGNEMAPVFSVTVNDGDVDSNTLAATINYTAVNDAPVATAASLTLNEGDTVTLSPANFGINDPDDGSFTYTVSGVSGGIFQLSSNAGAAITSFSSADLAGGLVQFVDDGNEMAPVFSVTVNDGDVDSNTLAATINYSPVNDAPVVTTASLTLNEGDIATLSPVNFGISDPDDGSFTYIVSGVSGGIFQLSNNAGAAITSFSGADLAGGLVQFVDDGNEVAPAFSVRVNDGDVDSNTLAATINYTAVNDAPVATAANLTLNEGETVMLSGANFGIGDPDDGIFTYTVSVVSGGIFQLSTNAGVAITSFSSADLAGGLVQFVDDGNEVAPAFSVTVNDGDVDSNTLAATINYTPVNDAPVVTAASLTLNEGDTVTLSSANLGVSDPDDASFVYTVSGVSGGFFQLSSNAGVAITGFTSADLVGGVVRFVDDANEVAPAFSVRVNDGDVDSNTLAATINYTPVNDAPVVTAASLTLNEGSTVTLSGANFGISDPDDGSFTYTVSGVAGGIFQLSSNAGVAITSFNSADLAGGLVQFVDDANEVAPAFGVRVNDGDIDSNTLAATINYTAVNDAPLVTAAILTLNEGETVTLSPANFGISDPDDSSFVYTVSGVAGGIFQLSSNAGVAITSFSSADLAGGLVQFVDDGNEVAPAFSIKVNDGDVDSNTLAATINYSPMNDTPLVTSASLTLNEGSTVTLSGANFGISDPDDGSFTYTVSGVSGGMFQLSSNAGVAIIGFSSADLAGGLVQFVDDGNEVAPAFSVTVNDGDVDSNTLAATISYTAVNDAPVLTAAGLTLNEGETVTLSSANFGITDPDDASFVYMVSGVSGGIFQLSSNAGAPITTFTNADLAGSLVQFVDDANEVAPAFSVTVNDGDVDSNTLAATIYYTPVNDAPVVAAASLMLNEGETVTLSGANFGVTDPDDTSFTYTLSGVTGGIFQLSNNAGVPITSFSSADLAGGLAQFVDDGNETAPVFSVTVNDGRADSNLLAATIGYAPVNDAPTVDHLAGDVLAYAEGSGPLHIDQLAAAWVRDDDSGNFDGGKLVIGFVSGHDATEDTLGIATTSHADGSVALTRDDVRVDGVSVGRAAGGTTGTDLVITFNTQATPAAVSAVLRAVSFENTNPATPAVGLRTLQVQLSDGDGGTAQAQPVQVWVTAMDDAPVGQAVTLGTPAEGQSLRAETTAIVDADGLGAFSYQWLRNGSAIGGATGVEYQLAADDIGAEVTVRVSWVDGLGKAESLTSGGTGRVARALQAPPSLAYGGGAAAAPAETTSTPAATAPETSETSEAAAAPGDGDPDRPTLEPIAPVPITVSEIETGQDSAQVVLPSFLHRAADLPSWLRRDDAETPQLRTLTFEWTPMEAETTKDENSDSALRESLRVQARAGTVSGSDVSDDGSSGNAASASGDDESNLIRILHDAKPLASASFTVGALWWLTRSGGLLTSILMGVPAWRHVDLLPVISGHRGSPAKGLPNGNDDDDGSDDDAANDFDDSAVADLFDDPASALAAEGAH